MLKGQKQRKILCYVCFLITGNGSLLMVSKAAGNMVKVCGCEILIDHPIKPAFTPRIPAEL